MNEFKSKEIDVNIWQALVKNAQQAYQKAYAPYSNFSVGAAAITTDNK